MHLTMADTSTTTIANIAAVPTSQVNNVTSAICTIANTTMAEDPGLVMSANYPSSSSSFVSLLGRSLLLIAKFIPGLLYWIVTFSTITLPTILFTLFSMSLTFTMNFTTLCVRLATPW